ncbi:MAG: tRNA lysidine(34) synthetase TilS, partial [Prevotellaceae bacterium]|nr:tRNA lysidine(34) synthetase TilS [Prevotellaceae bacterium]
LYANIDRWTETEHYYIQHINNDIAKMVEKQANGCWHINKRALNEPAGNTHLFLFEILSGYGFNPQIIRQIDDSINETSGRQFFSKTHRLINDRDVFILEEIIEKQQDNAYLIELDCIEITNPIHLDFKKRKKEKNFVLNKNKNTAQLDLSKLTFPLEIRKWQNGDSFVPFGMTQRQKISDFLINNKLSIPDKERVWLLLSGNEIAWIVGMRIDNRFCIDENTQDVLAITVLSE